MTLQIVNLSTSNHQDSSVIVATYVSIMNSMDQRLVHYRTRFKHWISQPQAAHEKQGV